tara:strand:+ start:65 stop:283 length:219 start_codon:yes stop_codon:yes gene_type:complete
MPTITELRTEAQTKGNELIKRFQELENAERQILAEKKQIEKQVDAINGEINAYNKIEPPVADAPNEAPPSEE